MGYLHAGRSERRVRGARLNLPQGWRCSIRSCADRRKRCSPSNFRSPPISISASMRVACRASSTSTASRFVTHTVVKIKQHYEGHGRQVAARGVGAEPTWAPQLHRRRRGCRHLQSGRRDMGGADPLAPRPRHHDHSRDGPSVYPRSAQGALGAHGHRATVPFARRHEYERKKIPAPTASISRLISARANERDHHENHPS